MSIPIQFHASVGNAEVNLTMSKASIYIYIYKALDSFQFRIILLIIWVGLAV